MKRIIFVLLMVMVVINLGIAEETVFNGVKLADAKGLGSFFLYAADPQARTVRAYTIDGNTGALSPVPGSPFPGGSAPMLLTVAVP